MAPPAALPSSFRAGHIRLRSVQASSATTHKDSQVARHTAKLLFSNGRAACGARFKIRSATSTEAERKGGGGPGGRASAWGTSGIQLGRAIRRVSRAPRCRP
jgi:hypothetical protein